MTFRWHHIECSLRSSVQLMIICVVTSFIKGQLSIHGYLCASLMQQIFQFLSFRRILRRSNVLNKEHERTHYHFECEKIQFIKPLVAYSIENSSFKANQIEGNKYEEKSTSNSFDIEIHQFNISFQRVLYVQWVKRTLSHQINGKWSMLVIRFDIFAHI